MPTGPVTLSKAWVEMIHRYLATMVGSHHRADRAGLA